MTDEIRVRVPGTTANCGPAFDVMGMACTIYNELELSIQATTGLTIEVSGEGADLIPRDEYNIAFQAAREVFRRVGRPYGGMVLRMRNVIPLARGLGSSAAAIVGGLVAANVLCGSALGNSELLDIATAIEGHPDNVAPALYGGVTLSSMQGDHVECLRITPKAMPSMVVAIPDFGLSTRAARQVLPKVVPMKDAVYNIGRTALLIGALCEGRSEILQQALSDRLHQPYRQKLVPGMPEVFQAAIKAGAYGAVISGAGPCLISLSPAEHVQGVGSAMVEAFARSGGVSARYEVLSLDQDGAKVIGQSPLT